MLMIYTVGEIAKKLNVTASTLRYYDKEGLLPFVERSSGGIRMFKDEHMAGLRIIECLKKTGMPIKDIKHFMDCSIEGDSTIEERLSIIKSQRDAVILQMKELQEMLDMLNYKCWYYETAKESGTCAVHDDIQIENVPKEYHKFINEK
jgi:DNA-binding transcriptional MerR regulator